MKLNKKTSLIIVIIIAAAAGAAGWYFYQESQKSSLERGAEKTSRFFDDVGKDTKKLFK